MVEKATAARGQFGGLVQRLRKGDPCADRNSPQRCPSARAGCGRGDRFEQLQPYLVGDKTGQTYATLAAAWQTTEAAIKMTVNPMRRRYRELFLQAITQTVSAPEEVEAEVHHLHAVLAG